MADVARPEGGAAGEATLGVGGALAVAAGGIRSAAPGPIWVQGEVDGLARSRAGHWYWSMAGDGARLAACALGRDATAIAATLERAQVTFADGLTVRVNGTLQVYAPRGQVQLRVAEIDPAVSLGAAVLARRDVRDRLATAGLSGRQAMLHPPSCPLRVAVVAPPGRGLEDFLAILRASPWAWTIKVAAVASEGPTAPAAIAAAVARAGWADLVVVARGGGGGVTAVYDSFEVARAVCTSEVPVVVAVGHTADASVADECAWLSLPTPTAAGEWCLELLERADLAVVDLARDIVVRSRARLEDAEQELREVESAIASQGGQIAEAASLAALSHSRHNARVALAAAVALAVVVVVLIVTR